MSSSRGASYSIGWENHVVELMHDHHLLLADPAEDIKTIGNAYQMEKQGESLELRHECNQSEN